MSDRLEGLVAIVTGAESGIGQAIACEFAANGADVAITWFSDQAGAQRTQASVERADRRAITVQTDVREPAQIAELFSRTQAELGTPYILVNAAGIGSGGQRVADTTWDALDSCLKTNVYGPFFACQQFVRMRLAAGGRGRIINITSIHDEIPTAGGAGYCASKAALRNLTRCLALEVAGDGITVNNIAPGMILTPMNQSAIDDPAEMARRMPNIPMRRAGEASEIAKLALYLASTDAAYATGQTFVLDGGLTINQGQGA